MGKYTIYDNDYDKERVDRITNSFKHDFVDTAGDLDNEFCHYCGLHYSDNIHTEEESFELNLKRE